MSQRWAAHGTRSDLHKCLVGAFDKTIPGRVESLYPVEQGGMWPLSDLYKVVERTHTDAMEQLQEGYVAAVAATAGAIAEFRQRDMHKYDVELSRQPNVGTEEVAIRLQLKSTTTIRPKPSDDQIRYTFKSRAAFDSLALPRTTLKHLLVVLVVNPDQRQWTWATHDSLSMRHCCYWINLEGQKAPDHPLQPVVEIPRANVFDASALTGILDRIELGLTP